MEEVLAWLFLVIVAWAFIIFLAFKAWEHNDPEDFRKWQNKRYKKQHPNYYWLNEK